MCYLITKIINGFYNCIAADSTQKTWSDSSEKAKRKLFMIMDLEKHQYVLLISNSN